MTPASPRPSIAADLQGLGRFLSEHQRVWATRPFGFVGIDGDRPPWAVEHPHLAAWCAQLPESTLSQIEDGVMHGTWSEALPAELRQWAATGARLSSRPPLSTSAVPTRPRPRKVRARKWPQVEGAIAVMAQDAGRAHRVFDWCGGKGHLGRSLAESAGTHLHVLDHDAQLLSAGAELGRRAGVATTTECRDVRLGGVRVAPTDCLVALHACGDLGARAVDAALSARPAAFGHAPCCWSRTQDTAMVGVSEVGRACGLHLSPASLRLATAEEGWGPPRRRLLRRQEMAWRLGLDLLRADASGSPTYRSYPPFPRPWLGEGFEAFVHHMAHAHAIVLPASWDPSRVEAAGIARARRVRAHGLVLAPFRRPLEVWLVLDRAQRLVEAGWQVSVGPFCSRAATPRNLWIRARPT